MFWVYYTSANDDGTWSVYREAYRAMNSPEPIDGLTERLGTYANEAEADTAVIGKVN